MRARHVAPATFFAVIVLLALTLVLDLAADGDLFELLAFGVVGVPFAGVGALLVARLPRQPIGWLMLAVGGSLVAASACDAAVTFLLARDAPALSPGWPALAGSLFFAAFFGLVDATLLVLPTGRLASRRWRPVLGAVVLLGVLDVLLVLRPGVWLRRDA